MNENDWQMGKATLATVKTTAKFLRNFRSYHDGHRWDMEFTHEVMFVMTDPQCHPPKTTEQLNLWLNLTL